MAARLLQAGHVLTVWDRTPMRAPPLVEHGAVAASSPAEAAAGVDFAITMLATPDALDQVMLGDGGVARVLHPAQIHIDISTVGPEAVRWIASRLPAGVPLVNAPVRGSVPQAAEGRLKIFVGASDTDFDRVQPILESLGTARHIGGPGSGEAMKLVANLVLRAAIAALGEALANLKVARAARAWLDEAALHGAADLDYSAVVATILGEDAGGPAVFDEPPNTPASAH